MMMRYVDEPCLSIIFINLFKSNVKQQAEAETIKLSNKSFGVI